MPNIPYSDKGSKNFSFKDTKSGIASDKPHLPLSSFFERAELEIESVEVIDDSHVAIYAHCPLEYGVCPYCGTVSHKVHSRYIRHPCDLPMLGHKVCLNLSMRKFFCSNSNCKHKTFAEQPGNEVFRYRRRTRRCEVFAAKVSLETSSVAASRILETAGVQISHSTVRRDLKRMQVPEYEDSKAIGVDDWAIRKGVTYGTIIVSLENGHPVDLLEDRSQESFKGWMVNHEKVEVVSRDRSTDYSSAIKASGRPIEEVADHFHLIMNMGECVTKSVYEHYSDYRNSLRPTEVSAKAQAEDNKEKEAADSFNASSKAISMFNAVKEAQSCGGTINGTAKMLGIARQTVRKYFAMSELPPRNSQARNGYWEIDQFVEREFYAGRSKRDIFMQAVREFNFNGSLTPFCYHYSYLKKENRREPNERKSCPSGPIQKEPLRTAKEIALIIERFLRDKELSSEEWKVIDIYRGFRWFQTLGPAVKSFYQLMKDRSVVDLEQWVKDYAECEVGAIKTFIKGLKIDIEAVKNCLRRHDISNGIVEGYVNKLKMIKRVMFGRAKIPLLKVKMVMGHVLFN